MNNDVNQRIEPSKTETSIQKISAIPRGMLTKKRCKQEEEFSIERRMIAQSYSMSMISDWG
jgi:hypothetical protein